MRHIPQLLVSSAALALALTVSSGAFAQQAVPAPATSSHEADNTAVNKRDRSSSAMTPVDQPNNKTDITLAAHVRRAIVKDKSLSMSAHNLKLVAANGVVTLRGPVDSAAEKATVATLVSGVRGVTRVDNQLDIKTP